MKVAAKHIKKQHLQAYAVQKNNNMKKKLYKIYVQNSFRTCEQRMVFGYPLLVE